MHKSVNQLFQKVATQYMRDKVPFDRIMAPCPSVIGRTRYVAGPSDFAETLRGMFGVADRCLSENGTITFSHLRDASNEWGVWLQDNPGKFEEVPNSAFQVWTGYVKDLNNDDVFVGANIEYMRFKTFRRVGSTATVNDVVIPDDVVQKPFNRVEKGNFVAPIDTNHPVHNEADEWLLSRGMRPMVHKSVHYAPFKYFLVEMDHDEGNYIQIPSHHPTNQDNFRWGMTDEQYNHILDESNKGTYSVITAPGDKYRVYGLWLCHWMMKKFCNPGEKVLVPFGGDGEMTLAALLNGSIVTVVEASRARSFANEDILVEWQRKFGVRS
jgi:hypothetical protein